MPKTIFPQITWASSFEEKQKIINSIAKETITCREKTREVGRWIQVLRYDIESLAAVLATRWKVDDRAEEAGAEVTKE